MPVLSLVSGPVNKVKALEKRKLAFAMPHSPVMSLTIDLLLGLWYGRNIKTCLSLSCPGPPFPCDLFLMNTARPLRSMDSWDLTYGTIKLDGRTFNDDFHTFGLYWDETQMVRVVADFV